MANTYVLNPTPKLHILSTTRLQPTTQRKNASQHLDSTRQRPFDEFNYSWDQKVRKTKNACMWEGGGDFETNHPQIQASLSNRKQIFFFFYQDRKISKLNRVNQLSKQCINVAQANSIPHRNLLTLKLESHKAKNSLTC